MQRALLLSIGLHVAVTASALSLYRRMPVAPDEPASIAVVFGTGAASPKPVTAPPSEQRPQTEPDAGDRAVSAPRTAPTPRSAASAQPGVRVERPDPTMHPAQSVAGNLPPGYPESARGRHEEGTVLLRLHIAADGTVARIETLRSSGYADLDSAAINGLQRWQFFPAEQHGQPVASTRDQPISFRLE